MAGPRQPRVGRHRRPHPTFASAATLHEIGFNHFFHGPENDGGADIIYFQGHAAPGIYARAFLEGRLPVEKLSNFRASSRPAAAVVVSAPLADAGLRSFDRVDGARPDHVDHQARFSRYLEDRGLKKPRHRRWAFLGDGETDEPESLGAISLAAREKLDNLVWVINCNLQRLDGPVRGNGQIIQELEASSAAPAGT